METKQRDEAAGILGVFGPRPEWAQAEIVAELEQDDCDTQTDYFAVKRTHRVRLAWSRHRRDIFSELRKAAATMEETAHLGPGRDEYNVRVVFACEVNSGSVYANAGWESPYHRDLARSFTTQAEADAYVAEQPALGEMSMGEQVATFRWDIQRESVEHREKYSMGAGYYLKAGRAYGSGWTVRKTWA